jgi:hypothetical protein
MSNTHAAGGQDETAAGKFILIISSALAALLLIAGLSYAAGTGARHQAALTAAGCEPGLAPSGLQCTTQPMLAREVMAVVTPATQQLNAETAAYTASENSDITTADAALAAEVTSEHAFDTSLAAIAFPPAIAPVVKAVIRAEQTRARLTAEQAQSSSLPQLRSFNKRSGVATAAVQTEMKFLRKAVDSPPQAG